MGSRQAGEGVTLCGQRGVAIVAVVGRICHDSGGLVVTMGETDGMEPGEKDGKAEVSSAGEEQE